MSDDVNEYREPVLRMPDEYEPDAVVDALHEENEGDLPQPGEHDPLAVETLAEILHEDSGRAWVEHGAPQPCTGWLWGDLDNHQREVMRFRARCLLDRFDLVAKE